MASPDSTPPAAATPPSVRRRREAERRQVTVLACGFRLRFFFSSFAMPKNSLLLQVPDTIIGLIDGVSRAPAGQMYVRRNDMQGYEYDYHAPKPNSSGN